MKNSAVALFCFTIFILAAFLQSCETEEVEEFIRSLETKKAKQGEIELFLDSINRCSRGVPCGDSEINFRDSSFKIFISFSLPRETLCHLAKEAQAVDALFVLRGMPQNSVHGLTLEIMSLRKEGVTIPIVIDPKAFSTFRVTAVPTYVLEHEEGFEKVVGNLSLLSVFEIFSRAAPARKIAQDYLQRLKGDGPGERGGERD